MVVPYHESVCCCHKVSATLTKLPEFVSFDIYSVPESQLGFLYLKRLKRSDIKNFWGSLSTMQKFKKKIKKKVLLLTNPIF